MYCWLCVEVCPAAAITMTPDYETATDRPEKLIRTIEQLRERGKEYKEPLKVETEERVGSR
jgi:formate hydrogenlyase subunit 6/NADH:ubiquinone oxidoreductase subunit I